MNRSKKNISQLLVLIASTFLMIGCAPSSELIEGQEQIKKELAEVKNEFSKIEKELAEIKKLLEERPAAPKRQQAKAFKSTNISIANSPFLGKVDAPVTIVEFTDYQCPFCKRFAKNTLPQIIKDYIDTGKVKYVFRVFPLKRIHPDAGKLAQAALCAGDQGKYWEMHDHFLKSSKKVNPKDLSAEIQTLKLNPKKMEVCLTSNKYAKQVATDLAAGAKYGVRGTPSFFLGKSKKDNNSSIYATHLLRGAKNFSAFKVVIDGLLK